MRINYSDEEDFAGQFGLFQANCARSIQGKAGQESLRELEAALLELQPKRLISGELERDGEVCAIGALVRHKAITPKGDPEYEMEMIGEECGMPRLVAWKVVEFNDVECNTHWASMKSIPYTPEERYIDVLKWVQKQLGRGV